MGLIRGIARTAVIAGTATAVSNRVSRRQQARWTGEDAANASGHMPPPTSVGPAGDDLTTRLDRLSEMRDRGQLTGDEYAAAKAQLLGL